MLEALPLCFGASLSGILTAGIVLEAMEAEDSERSGSTEEAPELPLLSALSDASLFAPCVSRLASWHVAILLNQSGEPMSASEVQLEDVRKCLVNI